MIVYLEIAGGIPLVKAFVTGLSDNPERQLSCIYLFLNFTGAITLSFFLDRFAGLLERFWPATQVEEWARLAYLHNNMLHDGESALSLMTLEHARLIKRFPLYMEYVRGAGETAQPELRHSLHQAFLAVSRELESFEEELLKTDLPYEASETLMKLSSRLKMTAGLDYLLHTLSELMVQWSTSANGKKYFYSILESMDFLLLVLSDAVNEDGKDDAQMLLQLTHDRSHIMQKMRKNFLATEEKMSPDDRMTFLQVTSLFERAVWIIHQLAQSFAGEKSHADHGDGSGDPAGKEGEDRGDGSSDPA